MTRLFSAATTTAITMTLGAALFMGGSGRAETLAPAAPMAANSPTMTAAVMTAPELATPPAAPVMAMALTRAGSIAPVTPEPPTPAAPLPEIASPADDARPAVSRGIVRGGSLDAMVSDHDMPAAIDSELRCLATAVYFESKSEPLKGQLAVAHVVRARAASGKFPRTLCGVVKQPRQFSFVRGGQLPSVPTGTRDWREAVAVAEIALADAVASPVPGALFFHATHVSPGWKRARVGQVQNHIFYR